MIIEIQSPGNTKREMKDKFELYEEAGVKEYWIVDSVQNFVLIYYLNESGKIHQNKAIFARKRNLSLGHFCRIRN
ncbi:MAG: Uma2 family endonuclease [Emticicia sp.]|nr:Uma2 family endonuclease [Emticicia sp.]